MFTFAASANETRDTILSCDPSLEKNSEDVLSEFRNTWDESSLIIEGEPTRWRLRALSHEEMINIERQAGVHRRSELGARLYAKQVSIEDDEERANWHDSLSARERKGLTEHIAYLDRWMRETIKEAAHLLVDGEPVEPLEPISRIRPTMAQSLVVSELCVRIQMLSTLDLEKKT